MPNSDGEIRDSYLIYLKRLLGYLDSRDGISNRGVRLKILAKLFLAEEYDDIPYDDLLPKEEISLVGRNRSEAINRQILAIKRIAKTPEKRKLLNSLKSDIICDLIATEICPVETISDTKDMPPKPSKRPLLSQWYLRVFYVVLLLLTVALTALLMWLGLVQSLNVNIDFNVGEIIAGLLGGAGVAAAGGAYAYKTIREIIRE